MSVGEFRNPSYGHWDEGWNDATGSTSTWHECVTPERANIEEKVRGDIRRAVEALDTNYIGPEGRGAARDMQRLVLQIVAEPSDRGREP